MGRGSVFLSPGLSDVVVETYLGKIQPPKDSLTPREREVLQLVAESKTTDEAASRQTAISETFDDRLRHASG